MTSFQRLLVTLRRNAVAAVPTILAIVVLNFFLLRLAPGDAADVLAGESGAATEELKTSGYDTLKALDLDDSPVPATAIYFQAGYEGAATSIATDLGFPTAVRPMPPTPPPPAPAEANVVVVLGQDIDAPASDTTTGGSG